MAASYPSAIKSFTTKNAGDTIQPGHINDLQDEVVAVETDLLQSLTTFVPSWSNLSAGNASVNAGRYWKIGKLVIVWIDLVWGNTTSISGSVSVGLPVNAAVAQNHVVGHGEALDAGTARYGLSVRLTAATAAAIAADNGTSLVAVTSTAPFTWTTSDELRLVFMYEAA